MKTKVKNEERTPFEVDQKYDQGQVSGKWRGQWCNYMTMMIETCEEAQRGKGLSSPVPIKVVMEGKRSWFSLWRFWLSPSGWKWPEKWEGHTVEAITMTHISSLTIIISITLDTWACNLNTWRNVENAPNKTEGGVLMKKNILHICNILQSKL